MVCEESKSQVALANYPHTSCLKINIFCSKNFVPIKKIILLKNVLKIKQLFSNEIIKLSKWKQTDRVHAFVWNDFDDVVVIDHRPRVRDIWGLLELFGLTLEYVESKSSTLPWLGMLPQLPFLKHLRLIYRYDQYAQAVILDAWFSCWSFLSHDSFNQYDSLILTTKLFNS